MRAEEKRSEDNVGRETQALPTTVLNAERGIINTGTVHGGQHVTTIDLSAYSGDGADGDL
ncbi:S-type pyocin domain-containing protein [Streptomyces bauhiniae]|uniref:S-type pyocin domain-containing protein n=1 Tax=Streptomyces bauhiniae TaxID=2340725 RepID=A0A4Z1D3L5_9ACTN|nr:S-type pyocin domain-containing protein [Streptomyces bauhiniae]TGN76670.1 S-type pyocin domain-containing protein [Streptomyces bauhiniae]